MGLHEIGLKLGGSSRTSLQFIHVFSTHVVNYET
jgi:hypothetical protein